MTRERFVEYLRENVEHEPNSKVIDALYTLMTTYGMKSSVARAMYAAIFSEGKRYGYSSGFTDGKNKGIGEGVEFSAMERRPTRF